MKRVSTKVQTFYTQPSRTQHHQANQVDVKSIMARARQSGQKVLPTHQTFYGDFTQVGSYQDALHKVMDAQNAFMTLPSKVRARFDNDPQKLLTFLSDPKNIEESVELGILQKSEEPAVIVPKEDKKSKTKVEEKNTDKE